MVFGSAEGVAVLNHLSDHWLGLIPFIVPVVILVFYSLACLLYCLSTVLHYKHFMVRKRIFFIHKYPVCLAECLPDESTRQMFTAKNYY